MSWYYYYFYYYYYYHHHHHHIIIIIIIFIVKLLIVQLLLYYLIIIIIIIIISSSSTWKESHEWSDECCFIFPHNKFLRKCPRILLSNIFLFISSCWINDDLMLKMSVCCWRWTRQSSTLTEHCLRFVKRSKRSDLVKIYPDVICEACSKKLFFCISNVSLA